jgi:hypothetical protein
MVVIVVVVVVVAAAKVIEHRIGQQRAAVQF